MSVIESKIVSVVNEINQRKYTDYIGLDMEIIKHAIPNITKLRCYISNKFFGDRRFSHRMKIANIQIM